MSTVSEIQSQIIAIQQELAILNGQLISASQANDYPRITQINAEIESSRARLSALFTAQREAQSQAALPTASSGAVISEAQQARNDGTTTSTPQAPPGQFVAGDDGTQSPTTLETGTDGRVRTITETQSTPPGPIPPFSQNDDDGYAYPSTPSLQAGVGARSEDNTPPNSSVVQQTINANFNKPITPEPNILDQYASYTYSISWYLLTPTQYNDMQTTQKKNVGGWKLLVQSGGIPVGERYSRNSTTPIFGMDYYMDNLEIASTLAMKGTGAANNAMDIKFTVTEPNGITLLNNLYNAVVTLYRDNNISKDVNYTQAQYCLAIRFYGYDDSGNLVKVGRNGAVVEKFYPFNIINITFRIANKAVEYQVTAKPIPYVTNFSQDRGTIPFAVALSGATVSDVLVGKSTTSQSQGAAGARTSTPEPTPVAPIQPDSASTAELFNDGTGYTPGYDPNAGWSA